MNNISVGVLHNVATNVVKRARAMINEQRSHFQHAVCCNVNENVRDHSIHEL